ncbi:MAG TPA: hypothetical protein VKZ66_12655, partial [Pusillimonas sp.]|uniref:hypothetical protein n=1 Tax=Pusillimonas sp. TaxID=3040095 RepID=UPI002B4B65A8
LRLEAAEAFRYTGAFVSNTDLRFVHLKPLLGVVFLLKAQRAGLAFDCVRRASSFIATVDMSPAADK